MRAGGPPIEGGYPPCTAARVRSRARPWRSPRPGGPERPSAAERTPSPDAPAPGPLPERPSSSAEPPFWASSAQARARADSDARPLLPDGFPAVSLTLSPGLPQAEPEDPAGRLTLADTAADQLPAGQPPPGPADGSFVLHVRWPGAPPSDRLPDVANRAAPALLMLAGDLGRAPLELAAGEGGLTLAGPGPLDERRSLLLRACGALLVHLCLTAASDYLLAHPALCAPADGGGIRIDQRAPDGRLRLRRGRLTELEVARHGSRGPATIAAQQSLTALVLDATGVLDAMLGDRDADEARRAALGFARLPLDAVTDTLVARGPRPAATAGAPADGERPLVCVLDMHAEPLANREYGPRRSALRVARALARSSSAEVVVCPWHQARVRDNGVTIAGPVLLVRGGTLVPATIPERVPAVMTFFPRLDRTAPGRNERERTALADLAAQGVRASQVSRYSLVARLLNEAAKRGAITNYPGWHGAWWRKDTQEYALRAHERITGRAVARPATVALAGRQLPAALRLLALTGQHAMIKPATGSGGAHIAVVPPGGSFTPPSEDARYVIQPVAGNPLLLAGHKVDVRFYLLIDTESRANSRRLSTAFVRMAAAPYVYGHPPAEVANTSVRLRAGLPPAIWPLDETAVWPPRTRQLISERLDELSDELLDALFGFAARRGARARRDPPRRVLFWGLDALLTGPLGDPSVEFLEVNTHPHLYRGVRECDESVDTLFQYALLPAMLTAARKPAQSARPARPPRTGPAGGSLTLLTTRFASPMPALLAAACAARGYQLDVTDTPAQQSALTLMWGWDVPEDERGAVVRWLTEAGGTVLNPRIISKWRQLVALRDSGLPVPRSAVAADLPQARAAGAGIGFPVVLKPQHGSYSRGVQLVRSAAELELSWPGQERVVQEYLPTANRCARLLVVGAQIVNAVNRIANDGFHATYDYGRGARLEAFAPTREEREIAVEACRALEIDIGGVDLVRTGAGPRLLEVNHRGVRFEEAAVHGPDAIGAVARYLCSRAAGRR